MTTAESVDAVVAGGLRDVPDFPQPGIVFKDITPLLADPRAFATVVEVIRARHDGAVDETACGDRVDGRERRGTNASGGTEALGPDWRA